MVSGELDPQSLNRYWHLCPNFVIELRSQTDRLPVLRAKMREWIENGAQLAWLIDPPKRVTDVEAIEGEGKVAGFTLDLRPVWKPLGD